MQTALSWIVIGLACGRAAADPTWTFGGHAGGASITRTGYDPMSGSGNWLQLEAGRFVTPTVALVVNGEYEDAGGSQWFDPGSGYYFLRHGELDLLVEVHLSRVVVAAGAGVLVEHEDYQYVEQDPTGYEAGVRWRPASVLALRAGLDLWRSARWTLQAIGEWKLLSPTAREPDDDTGRAVVANGGEAGTVYTFGVGLQWY